MPRRLGPRLPVGWRPLGTFAADSGVRGASVPASLAAPRQLPPPPPYNGGIGRVQVRFQIGRIVAIMDAVYAGAIMAAVYARAMMAAVFAAATIGWPGQASTGGPGSWDGIN